MDNRNVRQITIAAAGLFGFAAMATFIVRDAPLPSAQAAPAPIFRSTDHPFDPDWLVVRWILRRKCLACHRAGTDRDDLSGYAAVMLAGHEAESPAVVPFRPDESMLFEHVNWNVTAQPNSELADSPTMPTEKSEWLTAGQLSTMRRWIANGALEYRLPPTCEPRPLMEIDFPSAKECKACHPRQYAEWSVSMHAYAQHSPIFERFNLALVAVTEGTIGTFCSRCHTPVGTALGENESVRNVNRSRISMEGITCVVCHRRKDARYKSNGRISLTPGGVMEGCVYGPFGSQGAASMGAHPSPRLDYIKSSQFCGECHDVTSPTGLRLEEAFSEWHNSPAAKAGITCQACHMGPVQGKPFADWQRPLGRSAEIPEVDEQRFPLRRITSHIFAGPDHSMLPDTEFPEKLDWMYETDYRQPELLTPHQQRTLQQLRIHNRKMLSMATEKRLEVLYNSIRLKVQHPATIAPGGKLKLDVELISLTSGHSVPTGFTAERQMWISIDVIDPNGHVVFRTGDFDSNQDLRDDHSHAVLLGKAHYDPFLLNLQNKFVVVANKGTERSFVLPANRYVRPITFLRPGTRPSISFGRPDDVRIAKGSLAPLRTKRKTFPIKLPALCGNYQLTVRLNFRNMPPALLDAIGAKGLKHLLEVVVINEYQATVQVAP